ncbi:MAG: ABC-F family ATP-binding cassette domain-containing protein [Alphaproteobacteria bacterium]|nr:ABC-F family ATP-binding cassette domain-containing protein [Alphaproteobacteria bacterium]
MLFSVTDMAKSFGPREVLAKISFKVDEGHKIAVVGENGVGKSTLLKCIIGIEDIDNGEIIIADGKKIAYLPQEIPLEDNRTVEEYIQDSKHGLFEKHKIFPFMDGFGLFEEIYTVNLQKLSGGQKSKVLFIKFLLENADVYLLDEPTNNLDMKSLLWIEEYLAQEKKSMLIISHDLYFLKKVANRVLEINGLEGAEFSRGSYADYLERKEKKYLEELQAYKDYQKKFTQLKKLRRIVQNRQQMIDNIDGETCEIKSADLIREAISREMHISRVLKKRMEMLEVAEKPFEEELYVIEIHPKNLEKNPSISLKDVVAGYKVSHNKKGTLRIGPFSANLTPGKRICIMGGNGEGKTTLVKTILGVLSPLDGELKVSENIVFGDLLQQQERAERSKTVIEFVTSQTDLNKERVHHMIKKYHLPEGVFNAKIEGLSSGTRARLLLACFASIGVNTLILDEPTNNLDISGVRAIVQMLDSYKGIVIIISHNRWFLEQVRIDEYFSLEEGTLTRIEDIQQYITSAQIETEKMIKRISRLV